MADFSLNIKVNGAEQTISTIGEIEAALRATKEELKGVAVGSQEFERLSGQAQVLQREFKNSYKEATNFDASIGQLGESVGRISASITAGFGIATSALTLFGSEGDQLSETQKKALAGINIALGAVTLATNLKKAAEDAGNITSALGLNLTRQKTAAEITETVVKEGEVVATEAATAAQVGLNVAMLANPVGLLIAGIAALAAGLYLFSKANEDSTMSVEEQTAALNAQAVATSESSQALESRIDILRESSELEVELAKLRGEISEEQATSEVAKIKIAGKTNAEVYDIQKKAIEDEIKLRQNAGSSIRDLFIETYGALSTETDKLFNKTNKEINQQILNGNKATIENVTKLINDLNSLSRAYAEDNQVLDKDVAQAKSKQIKAEADALKENFNALKNLGEDRQKLELQNQLNTEKTNNQLKSNYKKTYDDISKNIKDFYKELDKIEADFLQKRRELALNTEEERIKFEQDLEQKKLKALYEANIKNLDKLNKAKRGKEKQKIDDEYKEALDALNGYYQNKLQLEVEKTNEIEKKKADQIKLANEILQKEISFGENDVTDQRADYALQKQRELLLAQKQNEIVELSERFKLDTDSFRALLEEKLRIQGEYDATRLQLDKLQLEASAKQNLDNFIDNLSSQNDLVVEQAEGEAAFKEAQVRDAEGKLVTIRVQQYQAFTTKRVQLEDGTVQTVKEINQDATNAINQYAFNQQEKLAVDKSQIDANAQNKRKADEKKTEDEILAYRIAKLQQFIQVYSQFAGTINGLLGSITELNRVNLENQLKDLELNNQAQQSSLNETYNQNLAALQSQYDQGLITQEQYNQQSTQLDTNLKASQKALADKQRLQEYNAKKKAFEEEKKLKIAQAIISGIQGALSAFTGAFQLGPIAGPIVGGILAALVAATTAVQVASISKTTFENPPANITEPNAAGGGAGGGAASAVTGASTGGFTGFNQGLVGPPTGAGAQFTTITPAQNNRVYVVESDITNSQNRVRTLESNATFG